MLSSFRTQNARTNGLLLFQVQNSQVDDLQLIKHEPWSAGARVHSTASKLAEAAVLLTLRQDLAAAVERAEAFETKVK